MPEGARSGRARLGGEVVTTPTRRKLLTADNVGHEIAAYLRLLATWSVPALPVQPIPLFLELKRKKVSAGPYPDVSIFELANRVMSDLVVLFAARHLLCERVLVKRVERLDVVLGTAHGLDVSGEFEDGGRLVGECFNVSQSFLPAKLAKARRDLRRQPCITKVIAFNHDAVPQSEPYKRDDEFVYLLVNVAAELERAAAPLVRS